MSKINWNFENTYFYLSKSFKEDIKPVPVRNPELILTVRGIGYASQRVGETATSLAS